MKKLRYQSVSLLISLLLVIVGCVPDGAGTAGANGVATTLEDFIVSFARNVAAAWIL